MSVHLQQTFEAVDTIITVRRQRGVVEPQTVVRSTHEQHVVLMLQVTHVAHAINELELLEILQLVVRKQAHAALLVLIVVLDL